MVINEHGKALTNGFLRYNPVFNIQENYMRTEINGFKIIEDFGVFYKPGSRSKSHYVTAICKECGNPWKTSYYTLSKIKACGCVSWKQSKPLPEYINGFKIISDLGSVKNGLTRRGVAECKVCHKQYEVAVNQLRTRKHCGCLVRGKKVSKYAKTHPRLRQILKHMLGRCHNSANQDYYNYGARGIMVCDEWRINTDSFCEWALANGYADNLTIDRIDSNKGYYPDNCRWSTAIEQSRNTRRVKLSMEAAREIRKIYQENPISETIIFLSEKFKVSDASIYLIIQNRTWKECQI